MQAVAVNHLPIFLILIGVTPTPPTSEPTSGSSTISSIPLLPSHSTTNISSLSAPLGSHLAAPPAAATPSISTLLATPLPSVEFHPPKASPLIISLALPLIPAKVVEKVQAGSFVDFKEFSVNNVILPQRLQELGQSGQVTPSVQPLVSGSRLREITDPLT